MVKKRRQPDKISPTFAKKALAALDVPLDNEQDRVSRLFYRLHGVEKSPPPSTLPNEKREYNSYYYDLFYKNIFKVRDQELSDLRRELGFRITRDPEFTDEELTEKLREFYQSRIPEVE